MTGGMLDLRRRRLALAAMVAAVAVVTLDTTILNVALPTIGRELNVKLASLQWVISGYSLTLASLLIIGGRIGDLIGVRRAFVTGAILFAGGSFVASVATSTPQLVAGESIIEGIGAALLFPASLAALSKTFDGPERAKAFALWGGVAGAAAALGPVIGGWLTSNYSWRWGFRINVVVAPLAALAAAVAMPADDPRPVDHPPVEDRLVEDRLDEDDLDPRRRKPRRRWPIDVPGAALLAVGLFMVVFALTEAPDHGWLTNHGRVIALGPLTVWSSKWRLSPVAAAAAVAVVALSAFLRVEQNRQRRAPLVDLSLFARRSFGRGLITAAAVVMAQAGSMFVLAVFLQFNRHLSAITAGRWLLPVGVAALVGARMGGRLAPRTGPTTVVRVGIVVELAGVLAAAALLRVAIDWASFAAALSLFGFGAGMASSQLTNVILSEVPRERAGSASGVSTTNNSLAAALGVSILGAVLRAGSLGTGSSRGALLTAAVLLTVGALASLTIPDVRQAQPLPGPARAEASHQDQPDRTPEGVRHGSA